mgnify:CR=1 FL=1
MIGPPLRRGCAGGAEAGAGLFRRALRWNLLALAAGVLVFAGLWAAGRGLPSELRATAPYFLLFTAAYTIYSTALGMVRGGGRLAAIPRLDMGANFGAKLAAVGVVAVLPGFVPAFAAHAMVQVVMVAVVLWLLRAALRAGDQRVGAIANFIRAFTANRGQNLALHVNRGNQLR